MTNIEKALELENKAGSSKEILEMIDLFLEGIKDDEKNLLAHWKLGQYYMLMGAAHAQDKSTKKRYYTLSMEYCEKAMMLNLDFKNAINNGSKIWDSIGLLGEEYVDAMGFWYTVRCYYFKECLSVLGRLFNVKMMVNNEPVITRIDELNPAWEGGGNNLSRAIYFIAVPSKFGGSKEKAAKEFETAIELGPNYLMHRWGRAKYLYSITGNKQKYVEDLEWVIKQDPSDCGNPYPWNVYFQNTAKLMLADADRLFK